MSWIFEPFQYDFMLRSFAAAALVGIVCAVVGCYLVIQSMAFLGDALAHAVLPGIAIAYLLGGNLSVGALCAAILVALGISVISGNNGIKEDTAIGILFTSALAFGVALMSAVRTYAVDLTHILFGNILGVDNDSLLFIAFVTAIVLLTIVIFYRYFLVVTFDPIMAITLQWNTGLIRAGLIALIACAITISINAVGASLVTAMLITPAATALMVTRELYQTMIVAAIIGAFSGVCGLYVSFFLNISSGACIALSATAIFAIFYLIKRLFSGKMRA